MLNTLIALAVVAVTQFISYIRVKNYDSALTIVVAAAVGTLAGIFSLAVDGVTLTWFSGLVAGLSAVGIHTVAKKVGQQS